MSGSDNERPTVGIGRERPFEVYVAAARGVYSAVPAGCAAVREIVREPVQLAG